MSAAGSRRANTAERWQRDLTATAIRRVLIIKWGALGDLAIASATMQDVRDAFPGAELHLDTMAPWHELFADDARFQRIFRFEPQGQHRGVAGHWRWVRRVRAARYDLVVDLQCTDHTRLLLALLTLSGRAPRHRMSYYRYFPYNIAPPADAERHHSRDFARAALAAGGIEARAERPSLAVPAAMRARAAALLREHGARPGHYAVLLPGSQAAGYLKRWGAARYRRLAQSLHELGIEHVVLLGGPDESQECRDIAEGLGDWLINLCGGTRILELIPICQGARLVVANDTGTAHVAAAAARPMLVICGPTDPRKVRPLGRDVVTVQVPLPCINCYRKHCAHHSCMRLVSVEVIVARLRANVPLGAAGSVT